jgi:two-component system NtrC family sensor kinase
MTQDRHKKAARGSRPPHGFSEMLHKRAAELTCLYGIARVIQNPSGALDGTLQSIAELLPPGWRYPEIASARILADHRSFASAGFRDSPWKQNAEILVNGKCRGTVEVVYATERPPMDEGPFSREERNLIQEVARQVSLLLEHHEIERDKLQLEQQLHHADRLATIGEMTAGAAHELNEPLGSILGFAQLIRNSPGLPMQAEHDIEKIVNAALHAREVIKKLLLFARKLPTRKARCSLNNLVREGLYFLESRCAREGISLIRRLDENLPEFTANAGELHQVLVNLALNAIQAMPRGGTLTIRTAFDGDQIQLAVEDTGIGMSESVMKQLFIPFFTTKGAGQGTGLGLPIVHEIVASHGGTISVDSQPGKGSRFLVSLPVPEPADAEENP